jgi:hypothetical protein
MAGGSVDMDAFAAGQAGLLVIDPLLICMVIRR